MRACDTGEVHGWYAVGRAPLAHFITGDHVEVYSGCGHSWVGSDLTKADEKRQRCGTCVALVNETGARAAR